jgi:hypothetical protein
MRPCLGLLRPLLQLADRLRGVGNVSCDLALLVNRPVWWVVSIQPSQQRVEFVIRHGNTTGNTTGVDTSAAWPSIA